MGRRKIEIKPIRDDRNRSVTFLKRKGGLFKKAHELSVLCSVDVAVIIFGHNKKLYDYSSSNTNEIVGRYQYTVQYGGAHEHKGPADFVDKNGGGDDDDDDDVGVDEGHVGSQHGTPAPEHPMMHAQMQHHPGFQNVRHGTPSNSPPMHNGAMPQVQRGPSPMPPNISRPASRADQPQHQGHIRRTSSNLVPPHMQQPQGQPPPVGYAYTPNPPFYNLNGQPPMQNRPIQQGHQATYPPPAYQPSFQGPYPPQPPPPHQQMQQAYMQDNRRASMPPAFPPQPPPPANMTRPQGQEHLQIPPQGRPPNQSPQPQHRPTPSPQPQQHEFASPPLPQPKPLPAHHKSHSIFTPIDDSRSMLAQHWTSSNPPEMPRSEPAVKVEVGPRPASIDVGSMQRGKQKASSPLPPPAKAATEKTAPKSTGSPRVPAATKTAKAAASSSEAKRPRLKVQIPSEQSGDEGGTPSGQDDPGTGQTASESQQQGPSHGVVLPPPSPSAGALLSAGAQGPPNPFARPAPPMSTNPHAMRESNHIETPISALPSRFMSDNLLPSPSTFYPEWGFGRSGDSNMLPSPLNFQTPIVSNGQGWRDEDRKRANDEELAGGDAKRSKS